MVPNMEFFENNGLTDNLSLSLSKMGNRFDNSSDNLSEILLNVSEINGFGNITEDSQALHKVTTLEIVILSVFYGAICITAILGNLLVLILVLVSKQMRTVTNIFIANLALADIIIAIFAIPFQFQAALLQKWNLPPILCAVCPFIQVLSVTVSILTLVVIALDRYRAVMHPFKAKSSKRMAFGAILAIWILSLMLALPTLLDYSVIQVTKNGITKDFCTNVNLPTTFRIYYNQSIVIIQYFLPLFIISKAYFRICCTLWWSSTPGNQEQARDAFVLRNKKKAIQMLFTVVLMFTLCWFPLQTYNFLSVIFPSINSFEYINILWFCIHWLAMSNSCCNPFIYAFFNKKFKTELFLRIPCLARLLPMLCSRVSPSIAQMNNRINGDNSGNQPRRCNIQVIYNPIQLNVQKDNVDNVTGKESNVCKIVIEPDKVRWC